MNWKWIYAGAVMYSLYEGLSLHQWSPFLFFFCCGITYLAIRDDQMV